MKINKISSHGTVDFAAEELKKYLRMMMPEGGDIKISYNPAAEDGFRLGLMQDFGLDVSDAEFADLDDIIYIECDGESGIIAGDNPRAVLLAVYEYLRQNGCRFLYPGVDGEYIPMKKTVPVSLRYKPTMRYRGWCNEGAESQRAMLETIDFAPKVGMNVYMLEFRVPTYYYDSYYDHNLNTENRPPEHITGAQVLQWKRQCEAEISKRSLQFHDIGHGWTVDSFGIDSMGGWSKYDEDSLTEEQKKFLPLINGKRGLFFNKPVNTQFCMSNPEARRLFVRYVCDYAKSHANSDYLHIWLADARNNHCECDACRKKRPSDWYVILLNELDEKMSEENIETRIVFLSYFDTLWAPLEEKIKNPARFAMLFAPITRSYTESLPEGGLTKQPRPFSHNHNIYPADLEENLAYLPGWDKNPHGSNIAYEYHFWVHQVYDLSGVYLARRINEDIKAYHAFGFGGIIEDGSQRSTFPNGIALYTYARTLWDTSLSAEAIQKDYFSHIYGRDWEKFRDYLGELSEALPFEMLEVGLLLMTPGGEEKKRAMLTRPEYTERLMRVRDVTARGRELIKEHYNMEERVATVSVRLLERHADLCDMLADALIARTRDELGKALDLFERARVEFGKYEAEIERYYDHFLYFGSLATIFNAPAEKDGQAV